MPLPIEILLFVFLLVTAVIIVRLEHLFAAAMLTGIFGLLSAGLFTVMDAVDVAFTEAAVGVGISTVLLLGTLALTTNHEDQQPTRLLPFVVVFLMGGVLIYGTLDMPFYGDPSAAIHHHVAPYYILHTPTEIGLPNFVTAILASYRGFDTLGETLVIFTSSIGVLLLLSKTKSSQPSEPTE